MRKIGLFIGMVFLIAATGEGADNKFDLQCSGTKTIKSLWVEKAEQYTIVYRINLGEKKWCEGECKAINDFHAIQPGFLTFRANVGNISSGHDRVDRETGAHMRGETVQGGRGVDSKVVWSWEGQCERAEFSGFPKLETKF